MRFIGALFLVIFSSKFSFAGVYVTPRAGSACYDPSSGLVYQDNVSGQPAYVFDSNTNAGSYSALTCSNITPLGAGSSCSIKNGVFSNGGQIFTINSYIPCSLDSDVWALLVGGGILGVIVLRKKSRR